jgi:murein DD-endopeptidase MepM/ murein hydrolase activator NlpD
MKKGQAFMLLLVIMTIFFFSYLFYIVLHKSDNVSKKGIGERQLAILQTAALADKALYYIDASANLAQEQALYELARTGGGDTGCGTYLGATLWRSKSQECWPDKPEISFCNVFDNELNKHLTRYTDNYIPVSNFVCKVQDGYIVANAINKLEFDIVDKAYRNFTITEKSAAVSGTYAWPSSTDTVVTSCFGQRNVQVGSSNHQGIDARASYGTPVFAIADGEVTEVSPSPWGIVRIKHSGGYESRYLHNSVIRVKKGDKVTKGQPIAQAGNTAPASSPVPVHIHIEIIKDGKTIDPLSVLMISDLNLRFTKSSNCYYNIDTYAYKNEILARLS